MGRLARLGGEHEVTGENFGSVFLLGLGLGLGLDELELDLDLDLGLEFGVGGYRRVGRLAYNARQCEGHAHHFFGDTFESWRFMTAFLLVGFEKAGPLTRLEREYEVTGKNHGSVFSVWSWL